MTKLNRKQTRNRRHKRVRSRVVGTASRPRLAVFRSNKHLYVQLLNDETGVVLAAISDVKAKTKKTGMELAKQLGKDIAQLAKEKKITSVVFDRGGYKYHGNVKALAEAVREQGIVL